MNRRPVNPRPSNLRTGVALATLVALAACTSNDDDADAEPSDDAAGGTSEVSEDRELSSEPGGDTSAIAGYWDASPEGPEAVADSRLVLIADNGLETSYELQQNDIDGSNCYSQAGPQTLTPGADDLYSRDDETSFTATRSEDGATLTVTVDADLVETWSLIEGRLAEDLPLCPVIDGEASVEPGPGDSTFNPDLVAEPPSSDPSGNDTTAVAGLWDASVGAEGRVDERFVSISADGLWTDYDFRQDDVSGEGNCYFITPLRLELETGDAADGTYSIADGRMVRLAGTASAATLGVNFSDDDDDADQMNWTRVEGQDVADLEACEGE